MELGDSTVGPPSHGSRVHKSEERTKEGGAEYKRGRS